MSLKNVGQNGAEEFFETILYMTAYEEAKGIITEYTGDIESDVVQEALQSAMTVVTMGVVFQLIRTQEKFIERIFDIASGLVTVLLASKFAQKVGSRVSGIKGIRLFKKLSIFRQSYSDRIATAQLVVNGANSQFHAERTAQAESNLFSSSLQVKDHIVSKESNNMELGSKMASRYNETLLFKLFTRNFSQKDVTLLRKILGSGASENLKADDLNKVADFMFIVGDDGEITGLTEQFFQLLNGMSYTHK